MKKELLDLTEKIDAKTVSTLSAVHQTAVVLGHSYIVVKEANDNAQLVLISKRPEIRCRVATPAGLMILKLISWADRAYELRAKDAGDIRYLLTTYHQIKVVQDEVYSDLNEATLEKYEWDPDLTACCLLGDECKRISGAQTAEQIALLKDTASQKNIERIAEEMTDGETEKNLRRLDAFMDGFGI